MKKSAILNLAIILLLAISINSFAQNKESSSSGQKNFFFSYGALVRGPAEIKEIALTFTAHDYAEGGPIILDILRKRNIKATFFLTGTLLRKPEFKPLGERIIKEGHYIGLHSNAHLLYCSWEDRSKTLITREEFLLDLQKNFEALKEYGVDKNDVYFLMPPYEWYNEEIARWTREAGLLLVNPTPGLVTAADYTTPEMKNYLSSADIFNQVLEYEQKQPTGLNGFIILFHLGVGPKREDKFYNLLDRLLAELEERAYKFVGLSNWLKPAKEEKSTADEAASAEKRQPSDRTRPSYTPEDFNKNSGKAAKVEEFFELSLTPVWEFEVNNRITDINIINDSIFWATEDKKIYYSKIEDLKNSKPKLIEQDTSFRPYYDGRLVWLVKNKLILGLNSAGQIEVRIKVDGSISNQPISDGQNLYLIENNSISCYSIEKNAFLWSTNITEKVESSLFFSEEGLIVPLSLGRLLVLDKANGQARYTFDFKEAISSVLCFDQSNIYVGTDKGNIFRLDAKKKKVRWKVRTGSQRVEYLVLKEKDLYVFTSGGLMLRLNRKNGDLLKWQPIPGKIFYKPLFFYDELIVPCSDRLLLGFDLKSSQKVSSTILPFELSSAACIKDDILFISSYSYHDDKSTIHAFRKEPQVRLSASVPSPQEMGRTITFTVQSAGFNQPRYEFFVKNPSGEEKLVRKASRRNTWVWFPVRPGIYEISVQVFDKKNSKKIKLEYNIVLKTEKSEGEKEKING